jgi:hypothetical protein
MTFRLPEEQTPTSEEPERLREWLSRMVILINGGFNSLFDFAAEPTVPDKAFEGMQRYFDEAKLPEIRYAGPWIYTNGEWRPEIADPNVDVLPIDYLFAMEGESYNDQVPVGVDIPLQVEFGPPQSQNNVTMDAAGTIVFGLQRYVTMHFRLTLHRLAIANTAMMVMWSTRDGIESNTTLLKSLQTNGEFMDYIAETTFQSEPGAEYQFWIMRDSSGADDGGLYPYPVAHPDISDVPSTWMRISVLEISTESIG